MRCPGPFGFCSPVCPLGVWFSVCRVLGHPPPVHWCARSVCCFVCALSWATWLLLTVVLTRCVVSCVRCAGRLGSCSPVCLLGVLCWVCGVLGHLAPVHRCARAVPPGALCCVCGVLGQLTPVHLCACSVPLRALCCLCGVLGHLAPVHRCARWVCGFACAVSWATCLLFTGVPARCAVLCVRCPGPRGSCSPSCSLDVLCRVCGVLGHLTPVHRCARSVCHAGCAVSWATWLLFTGVPARCRPVRFVVCAVSWATWLLFTCVPARCRPVRCVACAVSWAPWLLFTGVPARCVVLRVRCPGPLGSCSPLRTLGVLCCVCGVLGHLDPVHRCARSARCVARTASWAQ